MNGKVTNIIELGVIDAYQSGKSLKEAACQFGITSSTAHRIMRRRKVACRPVGSHRTRKVNSSFFSTIDTEEKAYLLGFIAADGCVTNDALHISQGKKDIDHLIKIRAILGSDAPLMPYNDNTCFQIHIYSRQIVADLLKNGIHQRKSHTLKPWPGPKHLLRHYWRGMFDGDGCVSKHTLKSGNRLSRYSIGLVGSLDVVSGFSSFVFSETGFQRQVTKHKSIFQVVYSSINHVHQIAHLLYDDASIFLERKRSLAMESTNRLPAVRSWKNLTKEKLLDLFNALGSWNAVARELKLQGGNLLKLRRRHNLVGLRPSSSPQ